MPPPESFDAGHDSTTAADAAPTPTPTPTPQSNVALVASMENVEYLRRHLRGAHPALPGQDVEDIVDTVMTKVIDRIMAGSWTPVPQPKMIRGYLRRATDWAALDFFRSARRTHESPVTNEVLQDLVLTDDEAVERLSRGATVVDVRAALSRIRRGGDATLFMVVTAVLDYIQRTGNRPSNRETAAACGLSHTAVAAALVRLRPYFEEARQTARDS